MTAATTHSDYLERLLQGQSQPPASVPSWLSRLRAEAVDRVGALTVPTTHDEEWRFTDIAPLSKRSFQPAQTASVLQPADAAHLYLDEASTRLAFVDGVHAPALSSGRRDGGPLLTSLAEALSTHAPGIASHLGTYAGFEDNVFTALNTAFLHDAALIIVPRNASVTVPVHVLFIVTKKDAVSHPRCLVVAEPGSDVTIVEDFLAPTDEAYFTNAVTEIAVADNARVTHVRVQRESDQAFHIAHCAVSLARASRYRSVAVTLGASISRLDLNVLQEGEGSECTLDGLALIRKSQLADTHTRIDHARPHGTSRQLHKCIVDDAAHAVFNGKIMVRAGAQRTDSAQSNRNLLLTGKARVDTKPQLEIFADDVRCAHGATVGQLEAEEVFYLQSRGFSESAARNLLTYAFGAEIIDRIPVPSLKARLEQAMLKHAAAKP